MRDNFVHTVRDFFKSASLCQILSLADALHGRYGELVLSEKLDHALIYKTYPVEGAEIKFKIKYNVEEGFSVTGSFGDMRWE